MLKSGVPEFPVPAVTSVPTSIFRALIFPANGATICWKPWIFSSCCKFALLNPAPRRISSRCPPMLEIFGQCGHVGSQYYFFVTAGVGEEAAVAGEAGAAEEADVAARRTVVPVVRES